MEQIIMNLIGDMCERLELPKASDYPTLFQAFLLDSNYLSIYLMSNKIVGSMRIKFSRKKILRVRDNIVVSSANIIQLPSVAWRRSLV